jgi:acetyltransferase-like isoleucine patch superfamily enzyme/dTDP-4-dehydrorhamnose 3,5-epimerase-like enzyme
VSAFIHPQAICETSSVGDGTSIWAFAHVLPGASIGEGCNICDGVFIENDVVVGSRVTVKSGVQLWDGIRLEDDVFIGPNATFTNDDFPRSRQMREPMPPTVVRQGASIGANATILPGLEIGKEAMVGAGAVVTRPVPPYAIVVGNPARIKGYVRSISTEPKEQDGDKQVPAEALGVGGVRLHTFAQHRDLRGSLVAHTLVGEKDLPFKPARVFFVFDVPSPEVRGEHAHRECHQLLVPITGSVRVVVDDGKHRVDVHLNDRTTALHIPPKIWSMQYDYTETTILMVYASHLYDPDDYIRDYGEFLRMRSEL